MTTSAGSDIQPARIAVFRALQLGDMLCAVPALRALRQAFPTAHVTLVSLPNARSFVARFDRYIDELLEFPGTADFPEQAAREQA
ncbi:MAG TPA: LPS biosynthesis glycosyltransferase, partial [Bordetella sp.]|nr:LPS biosynthesis glycosyltransferase [Bordetella sp.]